MEEKEGYLNPELSIEERVEDLLSKMTLEEKAGQLKARILHIWKLLADIFEGLEENQQRKFGKVFSELFRDRELIEAISTNLWRRKWKDIILEGDIL